MNFSLRKLWRGVTITALVLVLATGQLLFSVAVVFAATAPAPATSLPSAVPGSIKEAAKGVGAAAGDFKIWNDCVYGILDGMYKADKQNNPSSVPATYAAYVNKIFSEGNTVNADRLKKGYADKCMSTKWHKDHTSRYGNSQESLVWRVIIIDHSIGQGIGLVGNVAGDPTSQPSTNPKPGQVNLPTVPGKPGQVDPDKIPDGESPCKDGSCPRPTTYPSSDSNPDEDGNPTNNNNSDASESETISADAALDKAIDEACGGSSNVMIYVFSFSMTRYIACQTTYAMKRYLVAAIDDWFQLYGSTDMTP